MRRVKRIAYALLTAVVLTVSVFPSFKAKAGMNEILLDESTLEGNEWNNPEGDVLIEEKKIVFSKDSTDYTRFITKTAAKKDGSFDTLVEFSGKITLKQLPKEKSFILAFGLSSIESFQGDAGNIEVAFTNNGGIKMSIAVYDDTGSVKEITKPIACGISLNTAADVKVAIDTDGHIRVAVNGREISVGKLPMSGEGCVGFMQTGGCSAEVSKVRVVHYGYDRPENTNIEENFDKGAMDVSVLQAKMVGAIDCYPREQVIEEYQGNQVMMFRNTGMAYIGTVYQYSNFELTFDIPYLQSKAQYEEDGSLKSDGTQNIVVSYGGEQVKWQDAGWKIVADSIVIRDGLIYSNNHQDRDYAVLEQNPFEDETGFSLKLTVVDGNVTVGMKSLQEKSFRTLLSYRTDAGTPSGHVHIWTPGAANFAIDNIKITNLDESPNLIHTEFQSGKIEVPKDYQEEPIKRVYAVPEKEGTSWYLLIPVAAVTGGVILGVSALVVNRKKRIKEATRDEQ